MPDQMLEDSLLGVESLLEIEDFDTVAEYKQDPVAEHLQVLNVVFGVELDVADHFPSLIIPEVESVARVV